MTRFAELHAMDLMAEITHEHGVPFTAESYAGYDDAFRDMDVMDLEILVPLHD